MDLHRRIARWGRAGVALAVAAAGLTALTATPAQASSPLVVSLTFDDGLTVHNRAAQILEAHGARGTFYINSGAVDQRGGGGTMGWPAVQALATRGHEVGGHTRDHVADSGLSDQDRWTQICEDRTRLVEMGLHPTSFSYANGVFTSATVDAVRACGYQSARTAGGLLPTGAAQAESVPPAAGVHRIRALGATHDGPVTLEFLQSAVDAAYADSDGSWLPVLFHWVCEDADTACLTNRTRPVSTSVLDQFLTWLEEDPRDITVAPVSEVLNGGGTVPAVTVTSPPSGGGVDPVPVFSGSTSVDGPVTLEVLDGPYGLGSPVTTFTTDATGQSFSASPAEPLAAGTYSVRASMTAGGITGTSVPVPFRVGPPDTTAPAPGIITPAEGTNLSGRPALFTGTAGTEPGDNPYARLLIEGVQSGVPVSRDLRVSVFPGGKWSATPTLAAGTYTARVEQSDRSGNTGTSAPVGFTVDLDVVAPEVTITEPARGSFVETPRPTIAGTAGTAVDDIGTVSLRLHAGSAATPVVMELSATVAADGTWSATPTADLPDGPYTVEATQLDRAGNAGIATGEFTVAVPVDPPADTTAPEVTISEPVDGATVTTPKPTIEGTGGTATDDAGTVTVRIFARSTETAPIAALAAEVGDDGTWTATPTEALPDGSYVLEATQSDAAGNTGTATSTFTVKVPVAPPADTTAPDVTISAPADGATLAERRPVVSGTRGTATGDLSGVVVKLYQGSAATGTPVQHLTATPSTGASWSATPTADLPDGTYTVRATQADEAGNTGTATRTFTVKVPVTPPPGGGGGTPPPPPPPADTTAPTVTVLSPAHGSTVTVAAPPLTGTAGTAAGDQPTVKVKVFSGKATTGELIATLQAPVAADGTWSVTPAELPDGTYTVRAAQTDKAGNTGVSEAVTFTVDAVPPEPADTMRVDSVSGSKLPQGATGVRVTVTGDGFATGVVPAVSGEGVTVADTEVVDATTLVLTLDVAEGAALGVRDLVLRADGVKDATCAGCLEVTPAPTLESMSSDTVGQGARKAVVRLYGEFGPDATVAVSGGGVLVEVMERQASVLTVALRVGATATAGARAITVTHADGGRVTCDACLTVAPAPRASSLSRKAVKRGDLTWVTVRGSGFTSSTVARFSGRGVRVAAVQRVDATQVRLAVRVAPDARPRARHLRLVDTANMGRSVHKRALRLR